MTQRPLFAKAATFKRPRRTLNRWGDRIRVWLLADGSAKVVETRAIMGVALPRSFKAVLMTPTGECLVSRHKRLRTAQAAVVKATDQAPKPTKLRKVRR